MRMERAYTRENMREQNQNTQQAEGRRRMMRQPMMPPGQMLGQKMPQGQMIPPPTPHGWRERWMHRFGMDVAATPLTKGALTIPNWLTGKGMVFFFVSMLACWGAFGYVPAFDLWIVAALSVILFFYGGQAMSRGWERKKERAFVRNVFIAGFVIRLLWVLYCYFFFNPEYHGNTYGETADVDWYMPFAKDISEWITGNSKYSFAEIRQLHDSAIDDTAYPIWLAIGYVIWGVENDVFMPFLVKCIVNAYCAVCIYHVAKRHFGEGSARMAAIFVAINPNMIYWCGNMFKEAEMVFWVCFSIDKLDEALSSGRKLTISSLAPGVLAGIYVSFMRAALGAAIFLAVFAHVIMASNRVMSTGKKISAGVLVGAVLLIAMGDRIRTETERVTHSLQSNDQQVNMEWRTEREGGNGFAKYASAAVFAPLIFTIPFPTFNQAQEGQLLQIQLGGGSYIKNIFSFFVLVVMIMLLISGEWRRHVFILAYTVGYHAVLVLSNFAHSGRFHMPVWPMLMLFAAYGIQIAKGNKKIQSGFSIALVLEVVICLAWNWFKLKGRGMI